MILTCDTLVPVIVATVVALAIVALVEFTFPASPSPPKPAT